MTAVMTRIFIPVTLFFVVLAMIAGALLALFVPSIHAPAKHGDAAVAEIRSMFDNTGNCKAGDGAQMYSPDLDTWMFICFHSRDRLSIWVLSKHISDKTAREITAIPANQMRNAVSYLRNVIVRRGYILKGWNGTLPDWFWSALPK
ncbi:MAG: hypothetical protein KatS3mg054_0617 [Chloroflexus sp.]|nr:MAG: hypothetical protein KatS3mg054_0617 [Chloroflexus sp.]